MRWPVRVLATVIATATVALALGVTAAVLVQVLQGSLRASASDEARRRLDVATQVLDAAPPGTVVGREGVAVAAPGVAAAPPGVATAPPGADTARAGVVGDPDVVIAGEAAPGWADGYVIAMQTVPSGSGSVLVQARSSLEPARDALDALRPLLFVGIPTLLLLVAGLTWLMVGRALAPVSAIRETFTEITASDLHQRVPVPPSRDEVARLATVLNATLDRLERAVAQHRQFVADAAHELRSPIATLRTRLELGRRDAPALAGESLTDVGRIQRLAADLLLLARLDAGEPLRAEDVDLGQVAAEVAAGTAPPGPDGGVPVLLDVAPDVVVTGSRAHLGRMIGNLVENAVRHAASTVTVRVVAPATVEVCDDGPGIPVEHRESVFDRFTRLDDARARDSGGSGLGLAIARDIAHAHGGTLVVAGSGAAGACLRAELVPAGQPRSCS